MSKLLEALGGIAIALWGKLAEKRRDSAARPSAGSLQARHELSDWEPKAFIWLATGIFWSAVAMYAATYGLHFVYTKSVRTSPPVGRGALAARKEPPLPHLQIDNDSDRIRHDRRERDELGGYGWVDRDAGIVRIPIDEAMRRYVHARR